MAVAALITWLLTAFAGLYMLAVWLIESDVTDRGRAPTRLPAVVVFSHLTLALAGLGVWITYIFLDRTVLAWTAVGVLGVIASLGVTMFARWIPVYHGPALPTGVDVAGHVIPPEGNFPVAVVAGHGALAGTTFSLVLLTALGVGGG